MNIPIQNIYIMLIYSWQKHNEKEIVNVGLEGQTDLQNLFAKVLINGINHLISLNKGKNGYSILATGVKKNEHTYFVTVGVNPENYLSQKNAFDEGMQYISYMIARLLIF